MSFHNDHLPKCTRDVLICPYYISQRFLTTIFADNEIRYSIIVCSRKQTTTQTMITKGINVCTLS